MWNHWSDVTKKLKDIANEITQPHYEPQEDYHEGDTSSGGTKSYHPQDPRQVSRETTTSYNNSATNPYGTSQPLERSGDGGTVAPPIRQTAPSDITMTPPLRQRQSSVHEHRPKGTIHSGDGTPQIVLNLSFTEGKVEPVTTTPEPMVVANSGETAYSHEDRIAELLLQVKQTCEEKKQIEKQVLAYQEEVKEANKKTVEYYEQRMVLLQDQVAFEKKLREELEEKFTSCAQECAELQREVLRLQEHEKSLLHEVAAAKASREEVKQLLTVREEQYAETLHSIESLKVAQDALVEQVQQANNNEYVVNLPTTTIPSIRTDTIVNGGDTLTGTKDELKLKECYQRINTLERENLILIHQKEQMALMLKEEYSLLRTVFDEKEDILCLGNEQAELLLELIRRLENERRQTGVVEKGGNNKSGTKAPQEEYEELKEKMTIMAKKEVEELVSSLKAEIVMLRAQLDAAKQNGEEAVHRVKLELQEEHARRMFSSTAQHEHQTCGMIETLQRELQDAQYQLSKSQEKQLELQEEVQQLNSRLVEYQSEVKNLASTLTLREERVAELESNLAEANRANEGHDASLVSALTARKRELEAENAQKKEIIQQLEHIVSDCLIRADMEMPPSRNGAGVSFSDRLTVLASEFNRLFTANQNAMQREKEWERTYEQARNVNATLTQQVSEAWKTIGALREELSLRDQSLAKLKQQAQAESLQYYETQRLLTNVTNQLQALKEEKSVWEMRAVESKSGETCNQEKLDVVSEDVDALRKALHEREEELAQVRCSMETLQQVLDTFTQNKTRDVEERTVDLQFEIDQLRAQLSEVEEQKQCHRDDIDKLNANHRREIAAKNLEITSLYRKHAELRMALEETARQLNGSMMIDKRVISHLTVNFIHAFVGQRTEADEMLKVLSGLLNWDEAMQEKAGLLPGPNNPKFGQKQRTRNGIIGGIVSTMWGGSPGRETLKNDGKRGESPGIAELWVEFLMRESEAALSETKDSSPTATTSHVAEAMAVEEENGVLKQSTEEDNKSNK